MKTKIFILTVASLMLLVSATVWEGVTDVIATGDLPGNYSVATNSFPRNSVVDITNLENGKVVRALVVSGLETTGLLATLSRNAANSINLRGDSTCRIRITQPSDDIAFSRFKLGPVAAPSSLASKRSVSGGTDTTADTAEAPRQSARVEYDSAAAGFAAANNGRTDAAGVPVAANNRTDTAGAAGVPAAAGAAATTAAVSEKTAESVYTGIMAAQTAPETTTPAVAADIMPRDTSARTFVPTTTERYTNTGTEPVKPAAAAVVPAMVVPATVTPATTDTEPVKTATAAPATVPATVAPAAVQAPPESRSTGKLSLIPSEERIPAAANRFAIAPENRAPPLKTNNASPNISPPPGTSDFSPFQAPLINRLEQGKCYVQVATYQRVEHVEDELNRIGTAYPLAVQNVGSDSNPLFRVLLGPLNQGESGAMLQRFKSIGYNDAFIRYN